MACRAPVRVAFVGRSEAEATSLSFGLRLTEQDLPPKLQTAGENGNGFERVSKSIDDVRDIRLDTFK
jgi:hypothetical protein